VVIVLIDDLGFGQPSTFGGSVSMPTLDRLAAAGLRYNQFHSRPPGPRRRPDGREVVREVRTAGDVGAVGAVSVVGGVV
jgi:hypothetical protein